MLDIPQTSQVSQLLKQMHGGDSAARERLIHYLADRLKKLAHVMLRLDRLRRWEQPDDLLQNALLRLHRSLERSRVSNAQDLLQLAAREMRRSLIDLARHYYGRDGLGTHHRTSGESSDVVSEWESGLIAKASPPWEQLEQRDLWQHLYQEIEALPSPESQVVDLIWICGFTQVEAAVTLGVDRTTVVRRWRRARLKLYDALAHLVGEV